MSRIEIQENLLPLIGRKENVLDGITGFVEHYDFSKANTSYEARVQAITKVASICYQSPKSLGSIKLFERLQAESAGLPSSSYEFVPVLLDYYDVQEISEKAKNAKIIKYGEHLDTESWHLLTNLRALIEDVGPEESLNYLNTSDEEIQIIRDNFKVFLFNVDLPTRAQMVRHRVSWQELSRRYVSGKKKEFDFYVSNKMADIRQSIWKGSLDDGGTVERWNQDTDGIIKICLEHYNQAIASGVKPEEARRILPQAMMTQIWGAFQPKQLESYFTLRLDSHAQKEIRMVSEAMEELIDD